jgi:hypothetical protein
MVGMSAMQSNSAEPTDLIGMMSSTSMTKMPYGLPTRSEVGRQAAWKNVALAAIETTNGCHRDTSVKANPKLMSAIANMDKQDQQILFNFGKTVKAKAKSAPAPVKKKQTSVDQTIIDLPGVGVAGQVAPVQGFWDPFKLSSQATAGELAYFREAELKHGRVCMLALLGFIVQEKFHPLFGGDIDKPSIQLVAEPKLALFWPAVVAAIAVPELASLDRIDYATESLGFTPSLKDGVSPGDVGFDPLGLKPDDPQERLDMQNREILHGRLCMIATAGAFAQELLTQGKITEGGIYGDVPGPMV